MDNTTPTNGQQPIRDTVTLTVRVQPAVRAVLEAIARGNGWTLSRTVDEAVRETFGVKNFQERQPLDGRSRWATRELK